MATNLTHKPKCIFLEIIPLFTDNLILEYMLKMAQILAWVYNFVVKHVCILNCSNVKNVIVFQSNMYMDWEHRNGYDDEILT